MWLFVVVIILCIVLGASNPAYVWLFMLISVGGIAGFIWRGVYVVNDRKRAARINYMFNAGLMYDPERDGDRDDDEDEDGEYKGGDTPPHRMHPRAFEELIAEAFRRYGYKVVETPYQGDHGIDLKIIKPNEYAIVQCKRWAPHNKVGEPKVRDFFGAMQNEGVDFGYIITTSDFSDQAYEWAKGKRIVMINGANLQTMLDEVGMAEPKEEEFRRMY